MRYFFIAYSCRNNSKLAEGNLYLTHDVFPPNHMLRKDASERSKFKIEEIVITFIFEFKNEFDFNSFAGR